MVVLGAHFVKKAKRRFPPFFKGILDGWNRTSLAGAAAALEECGGSDGVVNHATLDRQVRRDCAIRGHPPHRRFQNRDRPEPGADSK